MLDCDKKDDRGNIRICVDKNDCCFYNDIYQK